MPSNFSDVVSLVQDGDTFQTNRGLWIRLNHVNMPEEGEHDYNEAKNYLMQLIYGREVVIHPVATDVFGRYVADVWMGGLSVNDAVRTFLK